MLHSGHCDSLIISMSSKGTQRRNRLRVAPSSSDARSTKRKRGAYKYTYISSKTRRGKNTWREANASIVYEDSDSETEPVSPLKRKQQQRTEDYSLVEYDREVYGDFNIGGSNDIQRKTKVSYFDTIINNLLILQTQNDFLRQYLPCRDEYLSVLLELEQLINNGKCEDCRGEEGFIRCLSCSGEHSWCPSCAVKAHQHHPFHNLQLWNGKFYQSTTLRDHGYIIHLGHGGHPCPNLLWQSNPSPWSDLGAMEDVFGHGEGDTIYDTQLGLSNLVIVHSTGVYSHRVSWCQCPGADKDRHLHLLKARLFPASITRPQSAFTFDVLDHFLIDALECKTSAMSFYQKLRRFTNNAFPHKISVSNFCIIVLLTYMIKRIVTVNLCGCPVYGGI
jgi:CxC2 like cysteine cluster associated with KDZ transposases